MPPATWPRLRRAGGAAVLLALGASIAPPALASPAATTDAPDRFAIPTTDDGLPGAGPIRRYEWFQNVWRERRSDRAQRVDQDRHAVVFLGDSITQGWGGGLGAALPGIKVANRGISGDATRGVLLRLQEDVLALHPAAVVLLIGTNELEGTAVRWSTGVFESRPCLDEEAPCEKQLMPHTNPLPPPPRERAAASS